MEMTRRVTEALQYREKQAQYHTKWAGELKKAAADDKYVVRLFWPGLDNEEINWELLSRVK